ncbi:hypothetical protein [Comamonas aquatica]|uniref:hypothetical protein n=1 Tax=Comamonas aquatica TaxID=225991 RepID=UPI0031DB7A97
MEKTEIAQLCFDFYQAIEERENINNVIVVDFSRKKEKFLFEENKEIIKRILIEAKKIKW